MPGDEAPIVYLLDGPTVSVASVRHPVPDGSRRLVALLALDRRCLDRRFIAGTLWPETDEGHAAGCLRTALWRLRREGLDIVVVGKTALQLRSDARVDVEEEELEWASRIIARRESPDDLVMTERRAAGLDLLPGWYDDWVSPHRERLRQRILHALDELSHALSTAARYADAVEVAQASVACDPLRESGQRALIRAHLAEGNTAEARRETQRRPGAHSRGSRGCSTENSGCSRATNLRSWRESLSRDRPEPAPFGSSVYVPRRGRRSPISAGPGHPPLR
jgi:DNA-binding SARP family transcriptional activator